MKNILVVVLIILIIILISKSKKEGLVSIPSDVVLSSNTLLPIDDVCEKSTGYKYEKYDITQPSNYGGTQCLYNDNDVRKVPCRVDCEYANDWTLSTLSNGMEECLDRKAVERKRKLFDALNGGTPCADVEGTNFRKLDRNCITDCSYGPWRLQLNSSNLPDCDITNNKYQFVRNRNKETSANGVPCDESLIAYGMKLDSSGNVSSENYFCRCLYGNWTIDKNIDGSEKCSTDLKRMYSRNLLGDVEDGTCAGTNNSNLKRTGPDGCLPNCTYNAKTYNLDSKGGKICDSGYISMIETVNTQSTNGNICTNKITRSPTETCRNCVLGAYALTSNCSTDDYLLETQAITTTALGVPCYPLSRNSVFKCSLNTTNVPLLPIISGIKSIKFQKAYSIGVTPFCIQNVKLYYTDGTSSTSSSFSTYTVREGTTTRSALNAIDDNSTTYAYLQPTTMTDNITLTLTNVKDIAYIDIFNMNTAMSGMPSHTRAGLNGTVMQLLDVNNSIIASRTLSSAYNERFGLMRRQVIVA
jgi:hypothetical protein